MKMSGEGGSRTWAGRGGGGTARGGEEEGRRDGRAERRAGRTEGGRDGARRFRSETKEKEAGGGGRHLAKFGDVFARTGHYSGPILAVAQGCGPAPCV